MLQQYTQFLAELNQNNNKEWFDLNRESYKKLQNEFQEFVGEIILELGKFDVNVRYLMPKDCTFRINRDVRFSKNKLPYKTYFSAGFHQGGKGAYTPGYYFQIEHNGDIMIGGGQYFIEPKDMFTFRTKIDDKADQLREIIADKQFIKLFKELEGERLKTHPKGFDKANPNIDLLKFKSFVGFKRFNINGKTDYQLKKEILTCFKSINPLVQYMREIMI
jgi:uncharacterized protein (TIGR02453 family)